MKNYYHFFVFFFLIAAMPASAINDKGNTKITGTVIDSVTQKPVEFASVALMKADSNTPVDGTVCDEKGEFTLNRVAPGDYKITISFIGFDSKIIKVKVEDKKDINLGRIIISPTPQVLKEVTVEGQKAIIEERVDRTVYNAENDATAKGGDATDVLKRVPMLSVDLDGNVSLRGNQNILVLINNKPSTIMAASIADALKQIPADQIKSVEVITSPSAKYDAEGSAGIINIITKKNTLEGLTLNIDAGVGLRGSNLGLNGNYRQGKMGFSLGGFGRANYNIKGRFNNEQISGDLTNIQRADTRNEGLFGHYNLGWDYDINKKNAMAASVRFGMRNQKSWQDNLTTESYLNNVLQNSSVANNNSKDLSNNVDANLTYTHFYDKPQRELSFQGLFSRNNRVNEFENRYENSTDLINRLNENDSYNQEITAQVDYQTPILDNQMLEIGAKNIARKVYSDFKSYEATGADGSYELSSRSNFSNNLNYDQNVSAGYLSYTYSAKSGYSVKAGSRYEYTVINAYSQTEDDIKIPSYGVLVPSVNLSKKIKNGNTLKLSYNRRIQRPSFRFLNPNIQWQNNLSVTQGDPTLQPEYTNNYELGYSFLLKGVMLNMTGFVRNTTGAIQSVRDTTVLDGNVVNRTTFQNIGNENAYGTSLFANINLGKLSLNTGGDVYYATLNNNNPNPELRASNKGWAFGGRLFGSYTLSKGWGLQFFSFYRGRQVQLQGRQTGFYMYSLAIRKEFNEKRGSIGLGLENFLQRSIKIKTNVETPFVVQNSMNEMFNTSIRLNFSYRIGKMSVDNTGGRRSRRTINNDDLKDGGGDNMQMGGDVQQRGGGMPTGGGMGGQRNQMPVQHQKKQEPDNTDKADTIVYDPVGTWKYTIDSPQGGSGEIMIASGVAGFTGTIKNDRMPQPTVVNDLKIEKNHVSFNYPVNFNGQQGIVTVAYTISGSDIQGTLSFGQFRSFNLTGSKVQ